MSDEPTRQLEPELAPFDRSTLPAEDTVAEIPRTGTCADDIEIGAEIARGGMGTIYRGRDRTLDREVAVKILQDRFPADGPSARRFLEEARITGQLQHPGIPPIHRAGTLPDGRPYLAMKLIKGQTLAQRLESKQKEPPGELLAIVEDIAQAVGYAHEHGVIHRDLKPANVMVGTYGEVQVMDWGLAKVLGDSRRSTATDPDATRGGTEIRSLRDDGEETQAGSVLGTPAYMPPEQAIGAHEQVDARSDVFGIGAILCTVLTGRPPYVGESSESTRRLAARAKLDDAFAALDRCGADPDLIALCKRCLAAEPTDRPADAGVVAREIAQIRTAAIERARRAEIDRAEAEVRAREETKRRRIGIRAVGSIAAVLAMGATLSTWLAVKANLAEREASHQLALTREAERRAHEEELNAKEAEAAAKASEAKAKEAEAKATDREAKERAARTEADKQKRAAKEQAATALAVKDFVCEILAGIEPKKKASPEEIAQHRRTTRKLLDYAVKRLEDFDGVPTIEAEIRNTIGMMYDTIGAIEEAEGQLKISLSLLDAAIGPNQITTITAAHALAGFYLSHGREADAKPLFDRCLAVFEYDTGVGATLAMQACRQLILIAQSQKRYADAIPYHERSRAISERTFGKDSEDELNRRLDLGRAYDLASQHEQAQREFRSVLEVAVKSYGVGNPITSLAWMDLQHSYSSHGKRQLVEESLHDEINRKSKALGPNHQRTRDARLRLAFHYSGDRKYGRSIAIYQELLRQNELSSGETINLLLHMGNDYVRAGQAAEAIRVMESAERIRRQNTSLADWRDYSHTSLESAYLAAHRPDKVAALCRERIAELRLILPAESSDFGDELAIQGKKLLGLRCYSESAEFLRECLANREKRAPNDWRTHNARSLLGGALSGLGRFAEAEPLMIRGYEGLKATRSEIPQSGFVNVPEAIDRLVLHFEAANRPTEAARWRAERAKYPREAAPTPREVK